MTPAEKKLFRVEVIDDRVQDFEKTYLFYVIAYSAIEAMTAARMGYEALNIWDSERIFVLPVDSGMVRAVPEDED